MSVSGISNPELVDTGQKHYILEHFEPGLQRNVRHSSEVLAGVTASMGRIDFGRISMIFLAYGRFAA